MNTPSDRLRIIGERLHGARWITALSKDLDVTRRRVHQWLEGETIPQGVWLDLERLEAAHKGWPRDEWLIATDAEGLREYIIHTRAPRFTARMAHEGADDADLLSEVYQCSGGEILCEVVWLDPVPVSDPELLELFQRAETAIDTYTTDSEEVPQ